jgi:hypothetical protein
VDANRHLVAAVFAVAAALASAGCEAADSGVVTTEKAVAFEPSLATFRDGFAVAWYDTRDGKGELYQQALDADGRLYGTEVRLTIGMPEAFEPDIQAVEGTQGGDGFLIGWYEKSEAGAYEPRLGFWSRNGAARWIKTLAPRGRNTVIRVHGELVYAAWIEDEVAPAAGVWTGWWNVRGEMVVAPRRVADAGKMTYNLNAALTSDSRGHGVPVAFVAFDATVRTKAEEIYVVEDDAEHAQVTRLTADDGFASKYPDLALSGSHAALTWFDVKDGNEEVYLSVSPLATLVRPDAVAGTRVTTTKGHSIGAYLTWNKDRVGLAWCDDTVGQHEIYLAQFDTTGTRRGDVLRLTDTTPDSLIPAIQPWRSGFALAWIEYLGKDDHDARGRSQVLLKIVP